MNVIKYIMYYFFPTQESVSILIATPIAHTISPILVSCVISNSIAYPMVYLTSYILVRPLSCITYHIINNYKPTYIELMTIKHN